MEQQAAPDAIGVGSPQPPRTARVALIRRVRAVEVVRQQRRQRLLLRRLLLLLATAAAAAAACVGRRLAIAGVSGEEPAVIGGVMN